MKFTTKALIVSVLFCLPTIVSAQQKLDTIFYNKNWKETKVKDSVAFYKLVTKVNNKYEVKYYYVNKTPLMTGTYTTTEQDIKDGYFKYFDEFGKLTEEGFYKNNLKEKMWKSYVNGKLWLEINYLNDNYNGTFTSFYKNGKIKRKDYFENGDFKMGNCYDKNGIDTLYYPFRIPPEFIGGEEKLYKYLGENVNYPDEAKRKGIEGKVIVKFYVDEKGKIVNTTVISNTPEILNQSAIKCVNEMPNWVPGLQDGEKVQVYYTIPIVFKLDK